MTTTTTMSSTSDSISWIMVGIILIIMSAICGEDLRSMILSYMNVIDRLPKIPIDHQYMI